MTVDATPDTLLLCVIRGGLDLTDRKFGCGDGMCGACTVDVDGQAIRSRIRFLGNVAKAAITMIARLDLANAHPVPKARSPLQAPQGGCCQSWLIMQTIPWIGHFPTSSHIDIDAVMEGNLCAPPCRDQANCRGNSSQR